jgi:uncharacterized protein YbcV (DUF1398 family)
MNTEVMKEALEASELGKSTFPQMVGKLVAVGVESYFADLVRGEETFYMPSGETHVVKMSLALGKIADEFSQNGIVSAIRAAQSDEIRYPEFVKRARTAGVAAYWAFLTGKKVVYFGRKGEFHVEEFPRPKT